MQHGLAKRRQGFGVVRLHPATIEDGYSKTGKDGVQSHAIDCADIGVA